MSIPAEWHTIQFRAGLLEQSLHNKFETSRGWWYVYEHIVKLTAVSCVIDRSLADLQLAILLTGK